MTSTPGGRRVFTGVAWPYASGPRHIGHVAGFGVPSDVFSRYQRMLGHQVLMVSGTDEHGTPILIEADKAGMSPQGLADRWNRVITEDLRSLGLSYDLFTRTTTPNHYAVTQNVFRALVDNGYVRRKTMLGAISPSTGRTLPDRYIEGTCPICDYPEARGDQCENCGEQLDPADLVQPRSRINGEVPDFVDTEHFFLDLPAFSEVLGDWLQSRKDWRPNILKFSMNLVDELRPRAISRDLDWGVPIPLEGWQNRPDKRLYVWFDAVIGYLSGSVEWARRTGDPEAWRQWWHDPDTRGCYFMGKDNIVFHSVMWPAILLGHNGPGGHGRYGPLQLPSEVVASEFLTMEGQKFSSSRNVAIYVNDFLSRYSADSLRYYLVSSGPERSDTDFTWAGFLIRNNTELVAGWGNLVNRVISLAHRHFGAVPQPGALTTADHELLQAIRGAFGPVGALLNGHRQRAALTEAMQAVHLVNKYLSEQAPWALASTDRARLATQLHVALQAVHDCNALLTPFLPESSNRVHAQLGGTGVWTGLPELREVEDGDDHRYAVLMGDYSGQAVWASTPIQVGTPLAPPTPVFTKLDARIVDDELARMESTALPSPS